MTDAVENAARGTLILRGVRGSVSHPRPDLMRYGAHTTCLEVPLDRRRRLILDVGTGILSVPVPADPGESGAAHEYHVLLTHYHRDHVEGLPFFAPLYNPRAKFFFYGWPRPQTDVRRALEETIRPPWFPVPLAASPSEKQYVNLAPGPMEIGGLIIETAQLRHPQGAVAYRIERPGGSFVFATDTEHGDPAFDSGLAALARGADLLIHDAHFTPEEAEAARGMGHSTWRQATEVARAAGVRRLVLFHHHPLRTDEQVEALLGRAREEFPSVEAAREGAALEF